MTGAEGVRRYRLRHASAKPVAESVPKDAAAEIARLKEWLVQERKAREAAEAKAKPAWPTTGPSFELEETRKEIAELKAELARERKERAAEAKANPAKPTDGASSQELEAARKEIAALKAELDSERLAFRFERGRRKTKVERLSRPPGEPGSEVERLEKRLASLTTENRNLKSKLRHQAEYLDRELAKNDRPSPALIRGLNKALQRDSYRNMTESEWESEADSVLRLLTQYMRGRKPPAA
jgi:hypothetical protein